MRQILESKALLIVWLILSTIMLLTLVAPLVLPAQQIYELAPECERQLREGTPCQLCGMTRAFVSITHGNFEQAVGGNRYSLPLYFTFAANAIAALIFVLAISVRRFRQPAASRTGVVTHKNNFDTREN